MGILLLVACEVTCMSPHQVQQPEGNVGRTVARVELRVGEKNEEAVSLFFPGVTSYIINDHLFSNCIATFLITIYNSP